MYFVAKSACCRQRTTSWNSGCSGSLVAIRTVVTWIPDAVVRSSGVATRRPTRITRFTDVPFEERLVSVVSVVSVVDLVLQVLVLLAIGRTPCLVDRCSGVIQIRCRAEYPSPQATRLWGCSGQAAVW
jgi:hypothetical protein